MKLLIFINKRFLQHFQLLNLFLLSYSKDLNILKIQFIQLYLDKELLKKCICFNKYKNKI